MSSAADVMTCDVVSIGPDKPLQEVARILYENRIDRVPVVDVDGHMIGVVTAGDLIGHAAVIGERHRSWWLTLFADEDVTARDYLKAHGRTAGDVMTRDVVTVEETATLAEVADSLHRHRADQIPVVRDGRLIGVVSRRDLLLRLVNAKAEPIRISADDHTIREQLLRELKSQPWAHVLDLQVENGVVHLHGTVQTDEERRALWVATENTPGVVAIEDHLTHWSSAPIRHAGEG